MSLVRDSPKRDHAYVILSQGDNHEDDDGIEDDDESHENYKVELNSSIRLEDIDLKESEEANSGISNGDKLNRSDESIGHIILPQNKSSLLETKQVSLTMKLLSALAYAICSFLITVINKIVLTSYNFPSANVLGLGQMIAILIILKLASLFRLVKIRRISSRNKKIWILATIYICNLITGLGSTKRLPLPMFIALRRISIAMTAIGEYYVLHVKQTFSIILTIVTMIAGSFIAAASDLTFNALGYALVMSGNFFTAANGVYVRKTIDSREINKNEILYYSALLTVLPNVAICLLTTEVKVIYDFEHWKDFLFVVSFLTSCFMGYLLMLSTIVCTQYNSPLTTTIVGTLKNILATYVGMYIGGDYVYSTWNFVGLNISLIGSLAYSYLVFIHRSKPIPVTGSTKV